MEVITIESAAFRNLINRIEEIVRKAVGGINKTSADNERWLSGKETMEMLFMSRRTLQQLRDSGALGFSKVGGKLYYKLSEINRHLEDNYQAGFKS